MRRWGVSLQALMMAVFLSVLISFSCVMCVNDAFELEVAPGPLLTACAAAAVVAGLACLLKRAGLVLLVTAVGLLAVLVWKRELVLSGLMTLVHAVTESYASAFPAVRVLGAPVGDPKPVLMILSIPIAWITVWIMGREGTTGLLVLAVMPVLVLVLVVVDLAPVLWLILLTGGILIAVISQSVRERSREEGSILAWWLLLPTIILLCLVTVLWPPADYVRADWSQTLQTVVQTKTAVEDRVENWQQDLQSPKARWNRELKTVDLNRLGSKEMTGEPALRYRAETKISLLRGVSLGVYEDNAWKALPSPGRIDFFRTDHSVMQENRLEIETVGRDLQLYTAYQPTEFPAAGKPVDDAYIQNTDRVLAYESAYAAVGHWEPTEAYDAYVMEHYIRLPEELTEPLAAFLREHTLESAAPQDIAVFLRNWGRYDLNTPRVPAGEDFALYFLTESRRGYCVHFASAAVLLLRSAGFPARYVTGYAVDGPGGQWNDVTEDDAHAWVEYYLPGAGWLPIDPTPADENPVEMTQQEPEPVVPDTSEPAPEPDKPESKPQKPAASETEERETKQRLWLWSLPGMVLLIICLRRWIALRCRQSRCRKGHPNRRALAYWRWLVQLGKAGGNLPEESLFRIAEKARFSQHTVTEEELNRLRLAQEKQIIGLKTMPITKRLWWKYGLILF